MNSLKKISLIIIVAFLLITNAPSFINNIIKERKLQTEYQELQEEKKGIEQDYSEIIKEGKQDQYYREQYNLSTKDDVLFEFPEE
ncbi:MAG: hypothetical protein ACK5HR_05480 [Mycoplasmatales bacterium]